MVEVILFECIKSLFQDYGLNGSENAEGSDVSVLFLSLKLWMGTGTDMHEIWAVSMLKTQQLTVSSKIHSHTQLCNVQGQINGETHIQSVRSKKVFTPFCSRRRVMVTNRAYVNRIWPLSLASVKRKQLRIERKHAHLSNIPTLNSKTPLFPSLFIHKRQLWEITIKCYNPISSHFSTFHKRSRSGASLTATFQKHVGDFLSVTRREPELNEPHANGDLHAASCWQKPATCCVIRRLRPLTHKLKHAGPLKDAWLMEPTVVGFWICWRRSVS